MNEIDKPPFVKTFESLILPLRLYIDLEVPIMAKIVPTVLFIIYLVLPFDLISDFIPIAGAIDDLAVLTACSYLLVKLTPPEIIQKYTQTKPAKKPDSKIIDTKSKTKK